MAYVGRVGVVSRSSSVEETLEEAANQEIK